jgi:hypothetical protein
MTPSFSGSVLSLAELAPSLGQLVDEMVAFAHRVEPHRVWAPGPRAGQDLLSALVTPQPGADRLAATITPQPHPDTVYEPSIPGLHVRRLIEGVHYTVARFNTGG